MDKFNDFFECFKQRVILDKWIYSFYLGLVFGFLGANNSNFILLKWFWIIVFFVTIIFDVYLSYGAYKHGLSAEELNKEMEKWKADPKGYKFPEPQEDDIIPKA